MDDNTYLIDELKELKNWKWDREIADYFKISRQSVTNWRMNKRVPKYLESLVGELKSEINEINTTSTSINNRKGEPTVNEIIELAKENGRLLEKVKMLEQNPPKPKPLNIEVGVWHSVCDVRLKLKGTKILKSIVNVQGKEECSRHLGYSIKELEAMWCEGQYFGTKEHPIDKLIAEHSKVEFHTAEKSIKQLCTLGFSILAGAPIPLSYNISYLHKNKSIVHTNLTGQLTFKDYMAHLKIKTRFGLEDG
tara:strand:- start:5923 stop:6672 length:750 start_codon:yes stop_codon:yes gene_type:complete